MLKYHRSELSNPEIAALNDALTIVMLLQNQLSTNDGLYIWAHSKLTRVRYAIQQDLDKTLAGTSRLRKLD
jgi:hypothetical protein